MNSTKHIILNDNPILPASVINSNIAQILEDQEKPHILDSSVYTNQSSSYDNSTNPNSSFSTVNYLQHDATIVDAPMLSAMEQMFSGIQQP